MALYVAICLLAALSAVSEHAGAKDSDAFKIVWGTTVGLALAHWLGPACGGRCCTPRQCSWSG